MATTLPLRRPANLFGKRSAAGILGLLALAGLMVSPASALSIMGVAPPGGGGLFVQPLPPDPCLPAPQIVSFTPTPATVTLGQTLTLNWNVQVPGGCNYLVALLGQSVGLQGSVQVAPLSNLYYTLTLSWGSGSPRPYTTATAAVSVNMPVDPNDPTRQLVTITSQDMVHTFVQALGTPNTTVVVDNAVTLNLSGLPYLPNASSRVVIGDGVKLIGGRTAVPGQPFQPGPLLFTTDNPDHLFEVQGDNVRVTGMRIQGPDMGQSPNTLSTGLLIGDVMPSCGASAVGTCGTIPGHVNVEVDHNEFSGWSHAAVQVSDYPGRIVVPSWIDHRSTPVEVGYALSSEPVYIHDNFFHHNQHLDGNGYGVAVAHGAHALIERNVFDWNRHAITEEDGTSRTGYRAYRNLVLQNGGLNVDAVWGAVKQYTQQFDMHGSVNACVGVVIDETCVGGTIDHYYGRAGHDFDVRYNSFLYTAGPAVKLRGTPELGLPDGAVFRFNVFAHQAEVDGILAGAVTWTENPPVVQDNLTGRTTYLPGNTPCDFDGDGVNDTFIATEQTLWYCPGPSDCVTAPGSGKATWVYLNTSTKRTDQLALGYFSGYVRGYGPHVCDVVDGGLISVGGSGPWKPLQPVLAQ